MVSQFPFSFWKPNADLMSGADGALSLDGTTAYINAGDIKRYSSISIINNGELIIRGFAQLASPYTNDGSGITLIGCVGNCTIDSGGQITSEDNGLNPDDFGYDFNTFTRNSLPFDCAYGSSISYTVQTGYGGVGGESGDLTYGGGGDSYGTGHGGGGGALDNGYVPQLVDWFSSGAGASGTDYGYGGDSVYPNISGFGANGNPGLGGETFAPASYGGGGSGGTRGLSGGCLYLQVGGTFTLGTTGYIQLNGSQGGNGGDGGAAQSITGSGYGGGSGAGAGGGSGGTLIARYKTAGTITTANVLVFGGSGGTAGAGGIAAGSLGDNLDGYAGTAGGTGADGTVDIAAY